MAVVLEKPSRERKTLSGFPHDDFQKVAERRLERMSRKIHITLEFPRQLKYCITIKSEAFRDADSGEQLDYHEKDVQRAIEVINALTQEKTCLANSIIHNCISESLDIKLDHGPTENDIVTLKNVLQEIQRESGGRIQFTFIE